MTEEQEEVTFYGESEHGAEVEIAIPMLSLRDYFAGQALTGVITAVGEDQWSPGIVAKESYVVADAMLKARKES